MFCNQCGGKIDSKDRFCPNCGKPVVYPSAGGHPQATNVGQTPNMNQAANANRVPNANQAANANRVPNANQAANANRVPNANQAANANRVPNANQAANAGQMPQTSRPTANTAGAARNNIPPTGASAPYQTESNVRYVQVDPQTGKIASLSYGKSRSESFMQWMTIAFIAIGLVIVMVAGSMYISGYVVKSVFADNVVSGSFDDFVTSREEQPVSSEADVSSQEQTESDAETETSSEMPVSSESNVPETLRAEYIQRHLKGKWTTNIPYKSMSLPATLVFDGKGKCSCEMKALFITKKFDGTYTVKDGGKCAITLNGLEEYVTDGNTMEGDIEIVSEDKMNFTVGDIVWELNKA